jgi:hypothetical protein
MQTHVATVPCVVVLIALAFAAAVAGTQHAVRKGSDFARTWFWEVLSIIVAAVLWFPPIVEELTGNPGNLTRLWRFFVFEPHPRQAITTAFPAWADMTTAVVRPHINIGWGAVYAATTSSIAEPLAVFQFGLLAWAAWRAWKTGHRFPAVLCLLTTTGLVIAAWSITRVLGEEIFDHQIFWISVMGALGWSALAAAAVTMGPPSFRALGRRGTRVLLLLTVVMLIFLGIRAFEHARAYAVEQLDGDATRKLVAMDVERYLRRERVERPLFHIAQATWIDAACVILQVYKHHSQVAVDELWVPVFGEALSANGREDADVHIADRTLHGVLSLRPGDRVISAHHHIYVHVLARR